MCRIIHFLTIPSQLKFSFISPPFTFSLRLFLLDTRPRLIHWSLSVLGWCWIEEADDGVFLTQYNSTPVELRIQSGTLGLWHSTILPPTISGSVNVFRIFFYLIKHEPYHYTHRNTGNCRVKVWLGQFLNLIYIIPVHYCVLMNDSKESWTGGCIYCFFFLRMDLQYAPCLLLPVNNSWSFLFPLCWVRMRSLYSRW